MKILICNERFLFRFGVDRVLLLLAKYFREMGHTIILMGNKMDQEAVSPYADDIICIPESPDYLNSNEFTCEWLKQNWSTYFNERTKPDIALIAGWPFYTSIEFLKEVCKGVVFNDYGAVPIEGFEGGAAIVQNKLRDLRKQNIPNASCVLAISDFIRTTQSIPDADNQIPTYTALLGADHMELGLWTKKNLELKSNDIVEEIQGLKDQGKTIMFLLGRWEDNYKNSPISLDILRKIQTEYPETVLLALANQEAKNHIPKDLKNSVKLLGFVDDDDLQELMKISDVGICPSLWEGFNLPLAEMQMLQKPIFVFNKGAHPEVAFHSWYLCETLEEMSEKILVELNIKNPIDAQEKKAAYKKFREYFTWERCAKEYIEYFTQLVYKDYTILIDVTNACHDTANSGVMRVTRRISQEIQERVDTLFVLWDESIKKYVFPTQNEIKLLTAYNGPDKHKIRYTSPEGSRNILDTVIPQLQSTHHIMLFTETVNEKKAAQIRPYLRAQNIQIGAIFYDAIPIIHPEFCNEEVTSNHAQYMKGLAQCDVIIPISEASKEGLLEFWENQKIKPVEVETDLLPGELEGIERNTTIREKEEGKISILCVSTLEPRKNHKTLLNACLHMKKEHPDLDWELILVGNRYAGNDEIPNYVQQVAKEHKNIKWVGVIDDEQLIQLYNECTFTVYPSLIEGFGMPIVESVWNGRPCICSNEGAMGEIANDGGCLTVNVKDEKILADAIYRLTSDINLRKELQEQATTRYMKTWDDYIITLLSTLYSQTKVKPETNRYDNVTWEDILYKGFKEDKSSLSNEEKMSLIALLERHQPECCIGVGIEHKERINILTHYADITFTIQHATQKTDETDHVTSLYGPTRGIMPILIDELQKQNIDIDLIVINNQKDKNDILETLESLKNYVPKKPLFIIIYDTKKTECLKQISQVEWEQMKYIQFIEMDFIKESTCGNIGIIYMGTKEGQV